MVNHSVEDKHLGKVNGMGQTFASSARAAGPFLGGAIWSLSLKHDIVFANFVATACVLVVCQIIVLKMPSSLDFKKGSEQYLDHIKLCPNNISQLENINIDV